jgi:hypothetical protein
LVARQDIEREAQRGRSHHHQADHQQRVKILSQQRFVDQQLRDVRLYQAETRRGHSG